MIEFQGWPKTPRLFRDMVVTEKIDGTNAAVIVQKLPYSESGIGPNVVIDSANPSFGQRVHGGAFVETDEGEFVVAAQSRTRLITPEADNFGFARWAFGNAAALVAVLGEGRHFGEWWGSGIQRGYDLPKGDKRFSLFNVKRYRPLLEASPALVSNFDLDISLDTVPVLYEGEFDLVEVQEVLERLAYEGSKASPGFMRPEGVVVYHTAANMVFKATIENDAAPKSTT